MSVVTEIEVALALLASLVIAVELGYRSGRRRRGEDLGNVGNQVAAIQGAVLGLLGLLLAFSFAAAGTRFMDRQDQIVQEANAIGTSYLRADLLTEPARSELRAALKEYTEKRIAASAQLHNGWTDAMLADVERMHARIWRAAREGVAAKPELAVVVLPPINDVIDLHSIRLAASRKRLPWLVVFLLVASSLLSVAMIGYGCGLEERRRLPLTVSLALLIGCALWITVDLDQPRWGLLRLSDASLQELKFE